MDQFWTSVVTITVAIVGLATVAVLVSRNAQTPEVISSAAGGFAQDLAAAVAPVTGSTLLGGFTGFSGQGGAGYQQGF
jgi:hypothetical protein